MHNKMTDREEEKLMELYGVYNETIKPLIAKIEAKSQKFPIEIFNEIRAFNDHVARCYLPSEQKVNHEIELQKAEAHIVRITLDCYKFLNVIYFREFKEFMRQDGGDVDYRNIESGKFFKEILSRKAEAVKYSEEARIQESTDKGKSLENWQKMLVAYSSLFKYIGDNHDNIIWAKSKFKREIKTERRRQYLLLIISIILSWMLGHYSSSYIKSFFNKENLNERIKTEQVETTNKLNNEHN